MVDLRPDFFRAAISLARGMKKYKRDILEGMALCRANDNSEQLVWAHKRGSLPAELCNSWIRKTGNSAFQAAKTANYKLFAGYFAAPIALEKPPKPKI